MLLEGVRKGGEAIQGHVYVGCARTKTYWREATCMRCKLSYL